MDNPHEILSTLEGTVERLKVIYEEKGKSSLDDDVAEVRQLCVSVEEVLRHQQKDKLSFWGERRDYWNYLSEGIGKVKSFEKCLKQVQKLTQFTTSQGKGRALIRECLSEQLLADCIQNCLSNQKRTKEWYHPSALVLVESFVQRLLTALYDLSDVTFELPQEGLELDETWPSFVLKSFGKQNGMSNALPMNGHKSPLQKVLGGATQVAKRAEKQVLQVQVIEKAVEEQPSEIYIKREIPFDLDLVGTLLRDVRGCFHLPDEPARGFVEVGPFPELNVKKLDDITSELSVLKSCVTAWTQEANRKGVELQKENKLLKSRQRDLELQVQETMMESDSSETDLVRQLQDSREELRTLYSDYHRMNSENEELNLLVCRDNEKIKELEDMNFDLEEQLARSEVESSGERQRAYTELETSLQDKEQNVSELAEKLERCESSNAQLLQSLADTRTQLEGQAVVIEEHQRNEEKNQQLKDSMQALHDSQVVLEEEILQLKSQNSSLVADLEDQKKKIEQEATEKMDLESKKWVSVARERDRLKAELEEVHASVQNEISALKFKLSSINIELQQTKEHSSKKDRSLAELKTLSCNLESQLGEARERAEIAEKEMGELKMEVQDIEGVLANRQVEMTSLHEQLTEKSLSRDKEREDMLKEKTVWDSQCQRLEIINAELKKQVDCVNDENEDLKRKFKRLLEQKVTLWQHADDLEQDHIAMGTWVDSKTVSECMNCTTPFTIFARKHHCRACGKVLCAKCCEYKIQLAISKDPSRVCETCLDRIQKKRTPFASDYINKALLESTADALGLPTARPRSNATLNVENTSLRGSPAQGSSGRGSSGSVTPTHRLVSSNSLNIGRTIDLSGNSLQAKLIVQNHTPEVGSSASSCHGSSSNIELQYSSEDDNDLASTTDTFKEPSKSTIISPENSIPSRSTEETNAIDHSNRVTSGFQDASFRSVSSLEYSVDPELRQREAEKLRRQQERMVSNTDAGQTSCDSYTVRSVQGATIDEDYYLIETDQSLSPEAAKDTTGNLTNPLDMLGSLDVGALSSKLQLLENFATDKDGHLRRSSLSGKGEGMEYGEWNRVEIGEGAAHVMPVPIDKAGTSVAWEFRTEPKGIAFSISYKESSTSSREDDMLPQKRCISHKTILSGDYCAQKKGIYILKFDNCHSKYTGRTLYYKVWTKEPK